MKKTILFLITGVMFFHIVSCDQKQTTEKETVNDDVLTDNDDALQKSILTDDTADSILFVGIWKAPDKLLWFEFYPDMTFSRGRGETVDEDRKNFVIDSEEKTLQIYTSRGVRSGKYKITADMLQITWEPKERTIQLERVEKRF